MAIENLIATQYQRNAGPSPMEQMAGMQAMDKRRLQNEVVSNSLDSDKRNKALQFAANVASQVNRAEDPQKKAEIYSSAKMFAERAGYDVSALPEQYNEEAQRFLDTAHMQAFNPDKYQAALTKAGLAGDQTKSSKIYSNGLTVQSTGQGLRVISPDGNELTGRAAAEAIREANEQEVQQQKSIYSGRSAGKVEGEREANIAGLKADITKAVEQAKSKSETFSDYNRAQASLPGLKEVVNRLKTLSDVATYTTTGKVFDTVVKELGFGATDGATARAKMQSLVDNQILPLLRDTFGAQFTEAEGERLRKTMLDIDAAPEQKKAILDSFLEQKMRDLQTKETELGVNPGAAGQSTPTPTPTPPPGGVKFLGFE